MRRSLFLSCLLLISSAAFSQTYTVTDLGTLPGGNSSTAYGLNATGQVVVNSTLPGNAYGHVALYSNGTLTDLGDLGGDWSEGFEVNASGQVTGYAPIADGTQRGYISNNGKLTALPTLGGSFSDAYAVNDLGQVVGASGTSNGETHPFLFSNGTMTDLGTLGAHGSEYWNTALGINKSGQIVGYSYTATGSIRGFFWQNGKMRAMGTLGGAYSQAYAINNAGQATGVAYLKNGGAHAFLFSKGKMVDVDGRTGTSTSVGWAINNLGVVVGRIDVSNGYHAFISTGKLQDLNQLIPKSSGWVLSEARGINDAGQISGYGFHNGQERAFLLTPAAK
jgi:probable HAF family extracellular repeat protein